MPDFPNKVEEIEKIMKNCEEHRALLINYCLKYFGCEYEYAEDCVQEAYVALYENLCNGAQIRNYKAYLYSVCLNNKNKLIKEKIKRNEQDFSNNEEKDLAINSVPSQNSDIHNQLVSENDIRKISFFIISRLTTDEKKLYLLYYKKGKKLKDIADLLNISYDTARKRHEKLKKKLTKMIDEYDI